jgi:hypothetical protein
MEDEQLRVPRWIYQTGVPVRINAGHVRSQRSRYRVFMGQASHGRSLHPRTARGVST